MRRAVIEPDERTSNGQLETDTKVRDKKYYGEFYAIHVNQR